jgi:uncharacterized membrane protein HdeD (DUF308 family)
MKIRIKSIPYTLMGLLSIIGGIAYVYTSFQLHPIGGFIEANYHHSWMEPWQCFLLGVGLIVFGIVCLYDSLRLVDRNNQSPK